MRVLRYIFCAFLCIGTAIADTISIDWIDGTNTYTQTTCEIGGDVILPPTPTRRGHTFVGWNTTRYIPILPDDIRLYPLGLSDYGKKVFNGTETWKYDSGYAVFDFDISEASTEDVISIPTSSHFVGRTPTTAWINLANNQFKRSSTGTIFGFKKSEFTDILNWKIWLTEQYTNGNPVTVLYPLKISNDSLWKAAQDTISGLYGYYNKDTDDFVPAYGMTGKQIVPVKYLRSSDTQYIDTNYVFRSQKTRIIVSGGVLNENNIPNIDDVISFIGTQNIYIGFNRYGNHRLIYKIGNTRILSEDWGVQDNIYNVLAETELTTSKLICEELNVNKIATTNDVSSDGLNIYLFGVNTTNGKKLVPSKLSRAVFYDNDVMTRDFIPVRVNNIGYMLDTVEWKIYKNAGTGEFMFGNDTMLQLLNR